jgi:hypothetical protein
MHKHSIPFYSVYVLEFGIFERRNQGQGSIQATNRSLLLFHYANCGYCIFSLTHANRKSNVEII